MNLERLEEKKEKLHHTVRQLGRVMVAFSGGVDSSFLWASLLEAGVETLAVTTLSPTMPVWDRESVDRVAKQLQAPHRLIESGEMGDDNFVRNPPDRCYYCKKDLFTRLNTLARAEGYDVVVDGCTADDLDDYRPGLTARDQQGVVSPLMAVGMTKEEVRFLSKQMGLPTWNRSASPCLSSRIAYGEPIEPASLRMIEDAERWLLAQGFSELRVRKQGSTARIELLAEEIPRFMSASMRQKSSQYLRQLGFQFVTLDLEGFKSGKMNRVLGKVGAGR
ncbi:MAG: ATP-dependent sacrificial sulfur transferase LarE [Magnetococcales bacterium]|nr:ATP-dependent sacrificial sulfur transferase LarE [Magnetococcales bacterium]